MTNPTHLFPDIADLAERCRDWLSDPHRMDDHTALRRRFDQYGEEFDQAARQVTELARDMAEMAAWCRLAVGLLRGEDVPDSIHTPDDEDPVDTARWRRWRVS